MNDNKEAPITYIVIKDISASLGGIPFTPKNTEVVNLNPKKSDCYFCTFNNYYFHRSLVERNIEYFKIKVT